MTDNKGKLRRQSHLQLFKKNKIPRNKPNQGCNRPVLRKLQDTEERNRRRYKYVEAHTVLMDRKN